MELWSGYRTTLAAADPAAVLWPATLAFRNISPVLVSMIPFSSGSFLSLHANKPDIIQFYIFTFAAIKEIFVV